MDFYAFNTGDWLEFVQPSIICLKEEMNVKKILKLFCFLNVPYCRGHM